MGMAVKDELRPLLFGNHGKGLGIRESFVNETIPGVGGW